jgi:hypothetical protein
MLNRTDVRLEWLAEFVAVSLNVSKSKLLKFVDEAIDSGLSVNAAEGWLKVGSAVRNKKRRLSPAGSKSRRPD